MIAGAKPLIEPSSSHPLANPFATRWTRPGAIPFQFPVTATGEVLLRRLDENGGRGSILGCHGSGKSTLFASLLSSIRESGREPLLFSLHDGRNQFRHVFMQLADLRANAILMIDGFEQLGRWQRWRLWRACRRQGCGLLVTSHRACGLPILMHLKPQIDLVYRLVEDWLPRHHGYIQPADVHQAWIRHEPNVREALFELYDVFERRRAGL